MSRRKRRYENRKKNREKKKEYIKQFDNFDNVTSLDALFRSAKSASKGVSWKASVQKYLINIFFRIWKTRKDLIEGKDVRKGFIKFDINERGKTRHIQSVHFEERVVQKSLCLNVIYPVFSRKLIYDNYASQKGKGTHFALVRLEKLLRKFIRKNGTDGYVLIIDFKNYFGNINHEKMKEIYYETFEDKKLINLSFDFIDAFGDVGLGLGSETSQVNAITFLTKLDYYIKSNFKFYGKYMDDSFIFHKDKDVLKNFLKEITEKFEEMGVVINTSKTRIIKLKRGFIFLKTRFFVTDTGKIIKKPCRCAITRERRKLKRQARLFKNGDLTIDEVRQSYESWKGSMKYKNARKSVYSMEKLYKKIFS